MLTKLFKSSKTTSQTFNVLYLIFLLGGALYALKTFHSYMDIYEKVILLGEPLTLGIMLGLPLVLLGSYFASRKVRL